MFTKIEKLINYIESYNGINDKQLLIELVVKEFNLVRDRSVYYTNSFAIRFSKANSINFSNTVLSLSNLQKFDSIPFICCIVCPLRNYLLLCNTTFLKKISHSSQTLTMNNIKGSFNGSDICRTFSNIDNSPDNFERLFLIHDSIGFEGNLERLVEATNAISGTGRAFSIDTYKRKIIMESPLRAKSFIDSSFYNELKLELDEKVKENEEYIIIASLIENVNIRGRIIEYLITGKDNETYQQLVDYLLKRKEGFPVFSTNNSLGDYTKVFDSFFTETDVKTKVMVLDSNPKGYNIDKMLEFLTNSNSVFLFYFIGIDPKEIVNTVLVSMFESRLLESTFLLKHWAGRNSRGVTQLEGKTIKNILLNPKNYIDFEKCKEKLNMMIEN